jgi:hypothetical protein
MVLISHGNRMLAWVVAAAALSAILATGCGGPANVTASAPGSSAPAAVTTAAPATTTVMDFCKTLVKLQHTADSDPAAMAQVLQQLRGLAADAPAEIRDDLQTEIAFGESTLRSGGTVDIATQGSLVRSSGTATRHLNEWEATHC